MRSFPLNAQLTVKFCREADYMVTNCGNGRPEHGSTTGCTRQLALPGNDAYFSTVYR
jgi:hypothetical protein